MNQLWLVFIYTGNPHWDESIFFRREHWLSHDGGDIGWGKQGGIGGSMGGDRYGGRIMLCSKSLDHQAVSLSVRKKH